MTTLNTAYVLDGQDRIISVSESWDEFAEENGGMNLSHIKVCDRPIWEFVTGDVTRMWLETILEIVRFRGTKIERPYRCDSPDVKRFMLMRIFPEQNNSLRIEHETLSTERRITPVQIRYGSITTKNTKQRCSICGRLNRNSEWQEPHENQTIESSSCIFVIYTVCDTCQRLIPKTD